MHSVTGYSPAIKQNYCIVNLNKTHDPVSHTVIKKYEKSVLTRIKENGVSIFSSRSNRNST